MNNVLDILEERGLLDDVTSPDLKKILESPVTLYAGFDPTQESLQLGNFVTIMVMAHFQRCGHKVIAVVGGATGMIGDPSGKTQERSLLSSEDIARNQAGIHENLSRFLDFEHPTAPAAILNNNDWLQEFSFVDFLRDVGKHFRMGSMLGKESVKARLNSDAGMSFTEFSYQMLQAYDFMKLYDSHDCVLQIGGSDQWGNITAGVDLMRKCRAVEGFGMTFPLLCDSNGQKFGKSEGNALFLSSKKTSYFDFYQFFIRTADADVVSFLKVLTFLSIEEIAELEKQVKERPETRAAQKRLAEEITRMVHGEEGLQTAIRASGVLFGASMEGLRAEELMGIFADVPSTELSKADVEGVEVFGIAASVGMCKSKGEARRLVQNGGLYLNNRKVEGVETKVAASDVIDGELVVLRSGKKRFHLIRIS